MENDVEITREMLMKLGYTPRPMTSFDVASRAGYTPIRSHSVECQPMLPEEIELARERTLTIIWSIPSPERVPFLNATAKHLQEKGFPRIHCQANPMGSGLMTSSNMYSTRGSALMLYAFWHPYFERDISKEIE